MNKINRCNEVVDKVKPCIDYKDKLPFFIYIWLGFVIRGKDDYFKEYIIYEEFKLCINCY